VVLPLLKGCRRSQNVLGILPNPNIGPFVKEDGEVVEGQKHISEAP
jgi:hypothetical protein